MAKGAKQATRRRRALNRGGRPRITGIERTRSGRMTKAEERRRSARRQREITSVAVAARKRQLGLSDRDAAHHDAPLVAWRWWKSGEIQEQHFLTAVALGTLYSDYLKAIKCPGIAQSGSGRKSADVDGTDPDYVAWCNARRRTWLEVRRKLLNAGTLPLLAAQSIAIENRDRPALVGEFRVAMNIAGQAMRGGH
jgi:hypothetical protein